MKLNDYDILKNTKCQLKDASRDTSKNPVLFMNQDVRHVIDFDRVKEKYLDKIGLPSTFACSVDAVFQDDKYYLYFVEFKNGDVEADNIKRKSIDSLLIIGDIVSEGISYTRDNATLILVIADDRYNGMPHSTKRAIGLAGLGKKDYAIYGLDKLRGYCYKEVWVMPASQFNKWIGSKKNFIKKTLVWYAGHFGQCIKWIENLQATSVM